MASADRELGDDWAAFAKGVGSQIAQALELARALSQLSAQAVRDFCSDVPQDDDITAVAIKVDSSK